MSVLAFTYREQNDTQVSDAVTIASLSTLASAAYSAPSTLVDNTPAGPHGISYTAGILRLSFSAALTAGAGSPYLAVYAHKAMDGTNLPSPPGTAAAAPSPNAEQVLWQAVASGAFSVIDFPLFSLDPELYGFQIYNGAGVAFSGTATLTLYRWNRKLA